MKETRRLAYLQAMDIDVWLPRGRSAEVGSGDVPAPMVSLGGGEGAILCVAGAQDEARLRLALNISNAMEEEPVWAWPAPVTGDEAAGMTLGDAVAERLFTRILVFGGEIAEYLFGAEIPEIIAAARVHVVPGLETLGQDREAKRILWQLMREQGIAAKVNSGKSKP